MGAISAALLLGALVTTAYGMYRSCLLVLDHVHLSRSILRSSGRRALERVYGRMLASTPISRMLGGYRHRKRVEALEQGMPEVLRLLCTALESGSSLVMALRYAADNCSEPLAGELKRTVWDLEAGQGFDEALEKLRQRTGGSEFAYLAVAMEIQHQSGGSLTDILESVAGLLQQTAELKDDLRTKTAQGRLSSRIVTIMPFALLAILSVFSPGYLTGFLSSPLGVCLFVLALLFEAAGIVLVRRAPWMLVAGMPTAYLLTRKAPAMLDARAARELRSACDEQVDVMADIVAMGIRSGLSFDAALDLYCDKFDNVLAHQLAGARLEWSSGLASRQQALESLFVRTKSRALKRFADTSIQAIHYGSPLADMLARFSCDVRRQRRGAIERRIAKAPVKLLVPTGTCILPAMPILVMGPVLLQFVQTGF